MNHWQLFLPVAAGGALGASARFTVSCILGKFRPGAFPVSTFFVNLIGSFLLGLLMGFGAEELWQKLLGTGFLGGFTTFSTLHTESLQLLREKRAGIFFLYVGLSYFLCMAAAAGGMLLSAGRNR